MAHCNKLFKYDQKTFFATSMLVMDFGDEMCWWQFKDIGDCFGHFGHQHSLSHERWAPTSKRCHEDLNSVANILKMSPTVSHQHHNVTNMTVALPTITWNHCINAKSWRDLEQFLTCGNSSFFSSSLEISMWKLVLSQVIS